MRTRLLLLLLASASLLAADHEPVRFDHGRQASVPVVMAGDMPLFPVTIAGHSERLWFLVDTGSPYTFVDAHTAARLGLGAGRTDSVHGAGGGEVQVRIVEHVTFQAGGLRSSDHDVRLTDS